MWRNYHSVTDVERLMEDTGESSECSNNILSDMILENEAVPKQWLPNDLYQEIFVQGAHESYVDALLTQTTKSIPARTYGPSETAWSWSPLCSPSTLMANLPSS